MERWCRQWKRERGGLLSLEQGWHLARLWYGERLSPNWRPFNQQEAEAIFAEVGLKGEFWELA